MKDEQENLYPDFNVPTTEEFEDWIHDSGCEATDGCWVEHDGVCPHGKKSWFLQLGLI